MIIMFDIGKDENDIWCSYYPSYAEGDIGFLKINRKTIKIVEDKLCKEDGNGGFFRSKAWQALRDLEERNILPEGEYIYTWH